MSKNTALPVQSRLIRSSTLAGVLMLGGLTGCGKEYVDAAPTVSLAGKALTLFADTDVLALKGNYHGCNTYADSVVWSMATGAGLPDANQVQVVKGDSACRLQLGSIDVNVGATPILTNFTAAAPFDMLAAYQSQAVLFSNGANNFYANVKLSSLLYTATFDVNLLYAQDPSAFTDGATAGFSRITANSVSVAGVPTPDYTSSAASVAISVQQDYSLDGDATGSVVLTNHAVDGDQYILSRTDPGSSVDAMDGFWTSNAMGAVTIMAASNISLGAATDLGLVGGSSLSTPSVWYVLVANWDSSSSGTRSYEKFTITFIHP